MCARAQVYWVGPLCGASAAAAVYAAVWRADPAPAGDARDPAA